MGFVRLVGSIVGFIFGFFLGAELLQLTQVTPLSNQVLVVFLLGTLCAILGWLGSIYMLVYPARWIVKEIHQASAGDIVGGAIGAGSGLALAVLLVYPLSLLPADLGRFVPILVAIAFGLAGAAAGISKRHDLMSFVREMRSGRKVSDGQQRTLLDTSVIIDGRVADIVKSGFVRGTLIVPAFILQELQFLADSAEATRRERGRRGLELLTKLQKEPLIAIELSEVDAVEATSADAKLVAVARSIGAAIMTNDYGLDRVAELQGVTVLNVNDLARAVRPVVLPGEELFVRVNQEGKEHGQGVAYLEDGTMIVVENGARLVGTEVAVLVMRVLQTVGGRMIFAQPKGDALEPRRPRVVNTGSQ